MDSVLVAELEDSVELSLEASLVDSLDAALELTELEDEVFELELSLSPLLAQPPKTEVKIMALTAPAKESFLSCMQISQFIFALALID